MAQKCSKCQIEKELDQYDSYFHSKQNKTRTRKICKICFNLQKKQYRESIKNKKIIEPVPVSVTPRPIPTNIPTPVPKPLVETKVCNRCKTEKPVSDFYLYKLKWNCRCKKCEIQYQYEVKERREAVGLAQNTNRPGSYLNEEQKKDVFMVMEAMGWSFNGTKWFKEGVRSGEDFVWEKMRNRPRYRKPVIRHKPNTVFNRLKNHMEDIVKLRDAGETLRTISGIYNASIPTLYKIINAYYEKK